MEKGNEKEKGPYGEKLNRNVKQRYMDKQYTYTKTINNICHVSPVWYSSA